MLPRILTRSYEVYLHCLHRMSLTCPGMAASIQEAQCVQLFQVYQRVHLAIAKYPNSSQDFIVLPSYYNCQTDSSLPEAAMYPYYIRK